MPGITIDERETGERKSHRKHPEKCENVSESPSARHWATLKSVTLRLEALFIYEISDPTTGYLNLKRLVRLAGVWPCGKQCGGAASGISWYYCRQHVWAFAVLCSSVPAWRCTGADCDERGSVFPTTRKTSVTIIAAAARGAQPTRVTLPTPLQCPSRKSSISPT